jgi:DNA-directed RNA polymerase specialized sigma24 family protein
LIEPLVKPQELTLAGKIAHRIGSRWSAVEVDDLTSHLYLWLVEHAGQVAKWRAQEGGEGKLYVTLKREAAKYCAKEQAISVGRPILADNFYTPELLTRALPYVFEDTPQTTAQINPRTGQAVAVAGEFDNALSIMADIKGAYYGLNPEIRQVLEWRFQDGLTYEEIGELRKMTKDGAKKAVDRAVKRLSDSLSGEPI